MLFRSWCSMLAGGCAINSIGGQCSFLVGQFLAAGFAEGAIRSAISLLALPLSVYLHSFGFQEYEQVPASGLATILIGVSAPEIKCKKTPRKKCSFVAEEKGKR